MNVSARDRLDECAAAFMLLTRLPVAPLCRRAVPPGEAVWAYPIVGLVVGAIGGAAFWALRDIGARPALCAIWAVAAAVLTTGALHEDGLADTADGLGGGRTRDAKLAIMRDSRIGAFGALALMFSLALRIAAFASLAEPRAVLAASIAAAVAGRGAMIGVLLALSPARADGLAAPLGAMRRRPALIGLGVAALATALLGGLSALTATAIAAAIVGRLASRQIGGYTGDILGAAEQLAECAALTACLSRFA
jgi:adenosylcobinamide-GDP ribazoletransferase